MNSKELQYVSEKYSVFFPHRNILMKTDLSQATFIIPIRIESPDRLRNVITITAFLVENFNTNIIVKEVDSKSVFQEEAMPILEEIVEGDIWKNFNLFLREVMHLCFIDREF